MLTEQNYCESLVKFLTAYAYPLDVERNPKSIMHVGWHPPNRMLTSDDAWVKNIESEEVD